MNSSITLNIFLDLESTIIENLTDVSMQSTKLLNTSEINQFIKQIESHISSMYTVNTVVDVFSFAIDNIVDKQQFTSSGLKDRINSVLPHQIRNVITCEEIVKFITGTRRVNLDMMDLKQLLSKDLGFQLWCQGKNIPNCVSILIDDVVETGMIVTSNGSRILLVNVDSIEEDTELVKSWL